MRSKSTRVMRTLTASLSTLGRPRDFFALSIAMGILYIYKMRAGKGVLTSPAGPNLKQGNHPMPEATNTHTTNPTRRAALRFGGIAAFAGAIGLPAMAVATEPDAELLALCEQFDALDRKILAIWDGAMRLEDEDEANAAKEQIMEQQEPILERILELRATTVAGFAARARTLALWAPDTMDGGGAKCAWNERMTHALLRDLMEAV